MTTVTSYGTLVWLADLARNGWELTVTEHVPLGWSGRMDQTVFDTSRLGLPHPVGVLATDLARKGAGIFVPCSSADAAVRLLERVEAEVGGMA